MVTLPAEIAAMVFEHLTLEEALWFAYCSEVRALRLTGRCTGREYCFARTRRALGDAALRARTAGATAADRPRLTPAEWAGVAARTGSETARQWGGRPALGDLVEAHERGHWAVVEQWAAEAGRQFERSGHLQCWKRFVLRLAKLGEGGRALRLMRLLWFAKLWFPAAAGSAMRAGHWEAAVQLAEGAPQLVRGRAKREAARNWRPEHGVEPLRAVAQWGRLHEVQRGAECGDPAAWQLLRDHGMAAAVRECGRRLGCPRRLLFA